ncbi:hypothetical protein [Dyella silvae]|uniref:hypothetical protein n=1 Tax=Dyella silvae TaxID=2994424 RepID=UPI002263F87E|nr:hypothetical protein [Dyella silvae]
MSNLQAYLKSYAGHDGGNPDAKVWVCGIEHGGGPDDGDKAFDVSQLEPESVMSYWTPQFKQDHEKPGQEWKSWPYHQKVAKLMTAIESVQDDPTRSASVDGWRNYHLNHLYQPQGSSFKLNLLPLSVRSTSAADWAQTYGGVPEIATRKSYIQLCREVRFPELRSLKERHKPSVIIGTGRTLRRLFAEAFGYNTSREEMKSIVDGSRSRTCSIYRDQITTLVVSPFFDWRAHSMNSDGLLEGLGKLVAEELAARKSGTVPE